MRSFFQGISFRLAKIGVVLAFVLGLLMSLFQLYVDFIGQEDELQERIDQIIQAAKPAAARAVHTLDDDLSKEVVTGLLAYDFIFEVTIIDELGNILSQEKQTPPESSTRWLTRRLSEDSRHYVAKLTIPGFDETVAGTLHFAIDVDKTLGGFYARSELVIWSGVLRNMILVLLLFVAFYMILTKPLIVINEELKSINSDKPGERRLTKLNIGRNDELTQLIQSANQLLDSIELSLAKRRAVEFARRKSEEHIRQIIDSLPVFVGARNIQGKYIFANKALASFLGRDPETMQDVHVSTLFVNYVGKMDSLLRLDRNVITNTSRIQVIEEAFDMPDGSVTHLESHIMPLNFYDEPVALVVSTDITERKQAQAKMEHMAYHDSLTNLPNRVHMVERLEHEIRRAERHGYFGAVLFIDLDQFKTINDSLGHPVGDEVLKQVAKRLQFSVREEDLVARISGDEFVIILTVLDQNIITAALKAGEVAEKIRHSISLPYIHDGMDLRVTCSIGVVVYPERTSSVHELLRFADTAMYQVKDKGRDAIEFFNEDMADQVSRQLVMEGDLHRALEENQFELFYQPKMDVETGNVVGAEALIRWFHPEKGMISPAEFIPVLETSGLILGVGQWVVEQSFRQLKDWSEQGIWGEDMRLSINISPRQFRRRGFVDDIVRTLHRIDIPEGSLEMEITEGIVIQGVEDTIATMTTLAGHGIRFSLDDFGTGYSSISYLKRLPVDVLKIDQSFVRDIIEDRNDRVLVETIVTMGKLLDIEVVAEGVETQDQLNVLSEYGCHIYQGYYASRPLRVEEFEAFLKERM